MQLLERAQQFESFVYTRAVGDVADTSSTKFRKALVADQFEDKFCPRDVWDYLRARVKDAMEKCPQAVKAHATAQHDKPAFVVDEAVAQASPGTRVNTDKVGKIKSCSASDGGYLYEVEFTED